MQRRPGTFTWQPPQNVNGELIGFDVRIYRENQEAAATIMSLDRFEFCFSPEPDMVPSGLGRVWVEVRMLEIIIRIMSIIYYYYTYIHHFIVCSLYVCLWLCFYTLYNYSSDYIVLFCVFAGQG